MRKVVITGAGGAVGTMLAPLLRDRYELWLLDLTRPAWCADDEWRFVPADLRDPTALRSALRGTHGVIHLGAIGKEDGWQRILDVNIAGTYNLLEAARLEGVQRVVYASSVHAVGFYPRSRRIGIDEHVRPDSRYGLSKCFGEAVSSLFADKYGIGVLVVRIGNAGLRPIDERRLSIWVSARDLVQLMTIGLEHRDLRYEIVYGVSANTRAFWDNSSAERLGYRPQDNSEIYAEQLLSAGPIEDGDDPGAAYQGGDFVAYP